MAKLIGINNGEAAQGWVRAAEPELFSENTVQVFDHDEVYVTLGED